MFFSLVALAPAAELDLSALELDLVGLDLLVLAAPMSVGLRRGMLSQYDGKVMKLCSTILGVTVSRAEAAAKIMRVNH